MIYLIGGPPRCGKTILARRLVGRIGCAWMQTDYLESAFSVYCQPVQAPPRLALDPAIPYERRNDALYASYSPAEIIASYRETAAQAWPGLRTLIEYALFDDEDLLLEGFHIEPMFVRQLLDADGSRYASAIRSLFLVRENVTETAAAIRCGAHKTDWVKSRTQDAATYTKIARMIVAYGTVVREEAERNSIAVMTIDGEFDHSIERGIALLTA